MKKVHISSATGAAAIAHTLTATGRGLHVSRYSVKFGTKPTTTPENITITVDAAAGAAYDQVYDTVDPGSESAAGDGSFTYIYLGPDSKGIDLAPGDVLTVAYVNTDTETYGSSIYHTEGAG